MPRLTVYRANNAEKTPLFDYIFFVLFIFRLTLKHTRTHRLLLICVWINLQYIFRQKLWHLPFRWYDTETFEVLHEFCKVLKSNNSGLIIWRYHHVKQLKYDAFLRFLWLSFQFNNLKLNVFAIISMKFFGFSLPKLPNDFDRKIQKFEHQTDRN